MPSRLQTVRALLLTAVVSAASSVALGDPGVAAYYGAPYTPTTCYGDDPAQVPPDHLFAAVGDDLWDEGAACGREYLVRCIGASGPGNCKNNSTIQIKILDSTTSAAAAPYKQSVTGAPLVLSQVAFEAIANPFADSIDIEFQE